MVKSEVAIFYELRRTSENPNEIVVSKVFWKWIDWSVWVQLIHVSWLKAEKAYPLWLQEVALTNICFTYFRKRRTGGIIREEMEINAWLGVVNRIKTCCWEIMPSGSTICLALGHHCGKQCGNLFEKTLHG